MASIPMKGLFGTIRKNKTEKEKVFKEQAGSVCPTSYSALSSPPPAQEPIRLRLRMNTAKDWKKIDVIM